MENCIAIIGYNNTRINDVKTICSIIKNDYNSKTLLIKDYLTEDDKAVTDYFFEQNLISNDSLKVNSYLQENNLKLIGVLPFSDRGVVLGAALAKSNNLFHDQGEIYAEASVHKNVFRQLEKQFTTPNWYKKVDSKLIYTFKEAENFLETHGEMFIKPTSEGNSRGCMAIKNKNDLNIWFKQYSDYLIDGVICETLIDGIQEYSYDNVGELEWITEKQTTDGPYKAEYNHIAPAPIDDELYERLLQAGRLIKQIIGSNDIANHIEMFLNRDGTISCVEPNRRPAGGKVFSFGNIIFNLGDYDVWKIWISKVTNPKLSHKFKQNNKIAGFRFIRPFQNITINSDKNVIIDKLLNKYSENIEIIELTFNKGDTTNTELKTNANFIGQVLVNGDNYDEVNNLLDDIEKYINSEIK
ncbi:ATP-grasp domain-containing protein [Staphylococcus aureus]|nr:ATP-grasp domain-containing protein [Staphylococcus aureus]MBH4540331.1 ATP-grasp domain-containing protein [Staphylococcus aureus]MBH4545072.1 ATP-grasp domain-containing protein [Staphylococcus aureus]MBH4551768.1 ATP-grasp domain-containing protein [Staphylococcus aureus]MBH4554313.1 ATP-grasp domain-containing protein [Staphylococcus aureus]